MNISGIVVRTRPETVAGVRGALGALPGVEVHGASEDGRMVITVEDVDGGPPTETLLAVQNVEGVLSATLAYNYNDHLHEGEEGDHGTHEA